MGWQGRELGRSGEVLEWGEWLGHESEGEFDFCALTGGVGRVLEAAAVMHGRGGGWR